MTTTTPLLSDVILYIRRIIKQPNQQDISDSTIQDYVNRFYIYDVPARIQLFDLKTQYSLELQANVDQYNAPITYLPNGTVIPTYNLFETPAFIDGYKIVWQQSQESFTRLFPNFMQNQFQQNGSGFTGQTATTPYSFNIANAPIVRGHRDQNIQPATNLGLLSSNVYINTVDGSGNSIFVQDDGNGNLIGSGTGTVNYLTGAISVTFNAAIPTTSAINSQAIPYSAGRPQAVLFFDNEFRFRPIPDKPYLFMCDAYYTPAAFLASSNAVPYRWMAEYIARGSARKILQDYGDQELLAFYEGYFREQENFVLRRTTRQNSVVRTSTIYTGQVGVGVGSNSQL